MRFFTTLLLALAVCTTSYAQPFRMQKTGDSLSFREMQREYNEWAKTHDLAHTRHWKYFKRWEMDMQLHTGANGEPVDPRGYFEAATASAHDREMAATAHFSSTAWYPVGPNALPGNLTGYMENGVGRINCIAFDPTTASTYYVGVAQGGLWKTTNNGSSWTPLTDNLPITRISDIAIDPSNTNTMYISVCDFEYIGFGLYLNGRKRNTHYGLGVYKTTDGGLTWAPTGLSFQLTDGDASLIRKVIVNPSNSNTLLACGVSGMYRSTNAGTTWTQVMDSLFWDMQQDPVNPNVIYAATGWVLNSNDGSAGIYKSTDFGVTWTMLNTGIPATGTVQRVRIAIAPSDNTCIYAVTVDTQNGLYGLYKSTNSGSTWTYINPGVNVLEAGDGSASGGQGNYDLGFMVHPTNKNILYIGGVNIWGSIDGGQSFNPVSHWTTQYGPTLHGDIHFIERQPLSGNIFVCSDGGIYRTTAITISSWNDAYNNIPWPTQWTNISNGMQITSFYRLSSSQSSSGELVAGAQDNATFYFDGTGWSTIFGGDGMDNYLDPLTPGTIIGSSQYGYFYLTNDGGQSNFGITANVNGEAAEWTSPIVADYNNYGTLYAGFRNVAKSTDGGNSWSVISSLPTQLYPDEICALAVANSNANVIYAARRVHYEYSIPGSVYKTINGGLNWTDITAGLPDSLYYTSMEAGETSSNTVYVSMAGFSAGNKVFRSMDGGATWQNISYNLPNIPVNCVKYIPGGGGKIIVATDLGLYTLDNASSTWVNASFGLPNVITSDIEFNAALNKVYVCTFGRGIWANDLASLITAEPSAAAADMDVELYPSVNDGAFTIHFGDAGAAQKTLNLDIIDVTGRIAYSTKLSGQRTYEEHVQLPAGMYFARLSGDDFGGVKRFMIR